MTRIIIKSWYKILISICLLSCSGTKRYDNTVSSLQSPPDTQIFEPSVQYFIKDRNDSTIGLINLSQPVHLSYNEIILYKVIRDEKSKYRNQNNQNIYEIKYGDDGFKLRNSNGQLLWKLKYREGKIKIADNEDMTGSYEIKQKDETVEIYRNEYPVQNIEMSSTPIPMEIKTGKGTLTVSGPSKNKGFAILAITEIPPDQQLILITEFLLIKK